MELETLKEIWNEVEPHESERKSREQILEILDMKSNTLIARMQRNLRLELLLVILSFGAVVIYYFNAFRGKLSEVSWIYLLLGLIFVGYYYKKGKLLTRMQCSSCQVKSNLQLQLHTLEKYIRFYQVAGTLMIPTLMLFFFWLFEVKNLLPASASADNGLFKFVLSYGLFTIAATITIWFLNKWYINKLYGRHIQKLKGLLDEFED